MFVCDSFNSNTILDFGAMHHMTPNTSILSSPQPHIGMSSVIDGNGHSLSISYQRSVCLSKSPSLIILYDVLCVSTLRKNLLSIHKFASDTNYICLLDSLGFVIKDK